MKEYKVVTAKNPEEAEQQMNIYAADGWVVKAVTFWETAMAYRLVITLERDSQATDYSALFSSPAKNNRPCLFHFPMEAADTICFYIRLVFRSDYLVRVHCTP